jgi:4-hydroxy-tetrahydrodipicolinate synthase
MLSVRRLEQEDKLRRVPILTGNGGLCLDFEMERGVDGAMTGYAFPKMLIDVVRLSRERRRKEAHNLFDAHCFVRYQQQGVGLATRKYVTMRRGIPASDTRESPEPVSARPRWPKSTISSHVLRAATRVGAPVSSSAGSARPTINRDTP